VTRPEFEAILQQLSGLRFLPSDLDTHWLGLSGVPADVLEAAVRRAAETRSQFPSPAELREDCDAVRTSMPAAPAPQSAQTPLERPLTILVPQLKRALTVTHLHVYHCEMCSDTGWISRWCDPAPGRREWEHVGRCQRSHENGEGHGAYVEPCRCRSANPVLQHERSKRARYVAERPTRERSR
jgi:hypothetical protein